MAENYLKKELYQRFRTDEAVFEFLQMSTLDGLWYWDLEHLENEWMSAIFWETLGYDPAEREHQSSEWQSIIDPDDLAAATENLKRHLENPDYPYDQVVRYRHRDGSTVWIRCKGLAMRNEHGQPTRMLGAHIDITELMDSHSQLNRLKNEYETVFNGSQDALFLIEVVGHNDFRFVRNNHAHQTLTGISQAMIEGKTPSELLDAQTSVQVVAHYQSCVDRRTVVTYEETLELPTGLKMWSSTLTPILNEGNVTHIVGSAVDVTERRRLEQQLERRANHDGLTGLANRSYLTRRLAKCAQKPSPPFAFVFIDLDRFKAINDNLGHAVGDQVLKNVARRLLTLTDDADFVARLGGDEFVILKCGLNQNNTLESFTQTLKKHIQKPMRIDANTFTVGASIGVAKYPEEGKNYDQLSRIADYKMYAMKRAK